jgi:hypothetical protein
VRIVQKQRASTTFDGSLLYALGPLYAQLTHVMLLLLASSAAGWSIPPCLRNEIGGCAPPSYPSQWPLPPAAASRNLQVQGILCPADQPISRTQCRTSCDSSCRGGCDSGCDDSCDIRCLSAEQAADEDRRELLRSLLDVVVMFVVFGVLICGLRWMVGDWSLLFLIFPPACCCCPASYQASIIGQLLSRDEDGSSIATVAHDHKAATASSTTESGLAEAIARNKAAAAAKETTNLCGNSEGNSSSDRTGWIR